MKRIGKHQAGFTLVEIAIVLVIIGLLLGGILKGQEMITQAKIKNIVNDLNGMSAAIYSYQDRYRALPGDDVGAAARWTTTTPAFTAYGGNGDGNFGALTTSKYNLFPTAAPASGGPESQFFWWHLRLSGFVPGATTGQAAISPPNNAVNGILGVQTTGFGFTSNILCTSNLPDKVAIAVDTQMDDGASASGQVRADLSTAPNSDVPAAAPTATAYQETGTNQYVACKNL